MPASHPPEKWAAAARSLAAGHGVRRTATTLGVGESWVEKVRAEARTHPEGYEVGITVMANGGRIRNGQVEHGKELTWQGDLPAAAKAALEDIALFARRYFAITLEPWQIEAANLIVKLLETEDEEYVVVNVPPGAGKSTFFTFILPCWLTCRDRTLRGLVGSASQTSAEWYLRRIKQALTTTIPVRIKNKRTKEWDIAESCLVHDYGQFRPDDRSGLTWAADAISVVPPPGIPPTEKENTWHAFGRSRNFLGARVDFQIWDDAYDPAQVRTVDARDELRRWWDEQVESRLEPAGLLVLVGQRLGPDDLYRHCLDKPDDTLDDDEDSDVAVLPPDRDANEAAAQLGVDGLPVKVGKYRHIIYRAHYPELCTGRHDRRATTAYPESCLLVPKRLTWKRLSAIRNESAARFATVYQQEDTPTGEVLVHPLWVKGGRDKDTGIVYVGCWDEGRDEWSPLPPHKDGRWFIAATVDPSPTKWWSIQLWAYSTATQERFLIAHHRAKMGGPDLLDWNEATREWTGIMQDWQTQSAQRGMKISHWIVEQAGAQRFLLQYRHVIRWTQHHSVHIVGHDTYGKNKSDEKLGVSQLSTPWRTGLIRLPGKPGSRGRVAAQHLVDEVTRYPEGRTEDCVMAEWFFEFNLPRLLRPEVSRKPVAKRPAWVRELNARPMFGRAS